MVTFSLVYIYQFMYVYVKSPGKQDNEKAKLVVETRGAFEQK